MPMLNLCEAANKYLCTSNLGFFLSPGGAFSE